MNKRVSLIAILALVALTCSGCLVSKSTYETDLAAAKADAEKRLQSERDKAQKRWEAEHNKIEQTAAWSKQETARAAALKVKVEHVEHALEACTSGKGKGAKELATCRIERRSLNQRLAKVQESIAKVRDAVKTLAAAGKLQIKLERGFLIIALQGDILFDSGKSRLKRGAEPVLLELAEVLKAMPGRLFQIAGHTDSQGDAQKNWKLSMSRALSVLNFLVNKGGVDGKGLSAGGYAANQSISSNESKAGRKKNRRVEFLLVPNLSELFQM